jgi:dihydrofolate reductase
MAKLIYVTNVSLDGYIEDEHGSFDWMPPEDDFFAFITDLMRPIGTYLYGRRLYDLMAVWETDPALAAQSELRADFANVWQAADKVVYSTTSDAVSTAKTRLEHDFDPASVREMKASATGDLTVGGARGYRSGRRNVLGTASRPRRDRSGRPSSSARVPGTGTHQCSRVGTAPPWQRDEGDGSRRLPGGLRGHERPPLSEEEIPTGLAYGNTDRAASS